MAAAWFHQQPAVEAPAGPCASCPPRIRSPIWRLVRAGQPGQSQPSTSEMTRSTINPSTSFKVGFNHGCFEDGAPYRISVRLWPKHGFDGLARQNGCITWLCWTHRPMGCHPAMLVYGLVKLGYFPIQYCFGADPKQQHQQPFLRIRASIPF